MIVVTAALLIILHVPRMQRCAPASSFGTRAIAALAGHEVPSTTRSKTRSWDDHVQVGQPIDGMNECVRCETHTCMC